MDLQDFQDFVTHDRFFQACSAHQGSSAREATLNYWDVSLNAPCCALCVAERPFSTVLQVNEAVPRRVGLECSTRKRQATAA